MQKHASDGKTFSFDFESDWKEFSTNNNLRSDASLESFLAVVVRFCCMFPSKQTTANSGEGSRPKQAGQRAFKGTEVRRAELRIDSASRPIREMEGLRPGVIP